MGSLSPAHEDTSEEPFSSCHWNAADCTKQDVQLYSKNISLPWAEPPPQSLHTWTLTSATIREINAKEKEKYHIWILTSTGTRLKLHMLLSPIVPRFLSPSHHKVSPRLPLQWRHQSHCRFLCCGSLPIANIDRTAVWQHWRQFMLISKRSKNVMERIPAWVQQHPAITCHPRGKQGCD